MPTYNSNFPLAGSIVHIAEGGKGDEFLKGSIERSLKGGQGDEFPDENIFSYISLQQWKTTSTITTKT